MIQFTKPALLEGVQLCDELESAGIAVNRDTSPMLDAQGRFWLDIGSTDVDAAQTVIDAHDPIDREAESAAREQARLAAIAHAKSLGFTDAMIAVMYPALT